MGMQKKEKKKKDSVPVLLKSKSGKKDKIEKQVKKWTALKYLGKNSRKQQNRYQKLIYD